VHTLWRGRRGLGAHPKDVPGIGKPEEKELCAGPPAAFGHDDRRMLRGSSVRSSIGTPVSVDTLTTTTTRGWHDG
jgi:hypothetical protein